MPDPESLRSAKVDYRAVALPREGFTGRVPKYPLPKPSARELEVWRDAWRTPQAAAWAGESWRHRTVAMWVRWSVRMEAPDASAAIGAVVVRLADQIGLTPAGLRDNEWTVARDEVAERREGSAQRPGGFAPAGSRPSSRERLRRIAPETS